MVPLFTPVTAHPQLAVYLTVISRVQVHLVAIVAHFVCFEALVAQFTEADQFFRLVDLNLIPLGPLVRDR